MSTSCAPEPSPSEPQWHICGTEQHERQKAQPQGRSSQRLPYHADCPSYRLQACVRVDLRRHGHGAGVVGSADDACSTIAGELEHLGLGHMVASPGVVIASAPWAGAVFDGRRQGFALQQAVDQPGRKRVATAHPVQDL